MHADQQRGDRGQAHREHRDAPARRRVQRGGILRRKERRQDVGGPRREDQPDDGRGRGNHRGFGQHLPQQPHPARAERTPHRDFSRPRRRAREQQAGDVRAGEQQHESDAAHQHRAEHDDLSAERRRDPRRRRHEHGARIGRPAQRAQVGVRILARQARSQRGELRLRLLDGDTVPQRADDVEAAVAALRRRVRRRYERHPHVDGVPGVDPQEPRRRDPHDLVPASRRARRWCRGRIRTRRRRVPRTRR